MVKIIMNRQLLLSLLMFSASCQPDEVLIIRPTEANVALALQPTIASKEEGSLKIVSSDVGE